MANIADNANIFVGGTLELFNQMQVVVARDGDVAGAQADMIEAMKKVVTTSSTVTAGSGRTVTRRKQ